MDVAAWLRELGLKRYEPAFREIEIDAEVLPELTESDLAALGLPIGPRPELLKAITALRRGAGPPVLYRERAYGGLRPLETRRHPRLRRYLSGSRFPSRRARSELEGRGGDGPLHCAIVALEQDQPGFTNVRRRSSWKTNRLVNLSGRSQDPFKEFCSRRYPPSVVPKVNAEACVRNSGATIHN
jgi:hypothetical protein